MIRRFTLLTLTVGLISTLSSASLRAQGNRAWEVSAFAGRIGAITSPPSPALLTPNMTGSPSASVPLFNVTLSEDSHLLFGGRVGQHVSERILVEVGFSFGVPAITATISGDAAGTANQAFHYGDGREWSIDGGVTFEQPLAGGWIRPFAVGSVGALLQTISGSGETLNGQIYRVGGGAKFVMAHPGTRAQRRAGIRADVVDAIRTRAFDSSSSSKARSSLMMTLSAFLTF